MHVRSASRATWIYAPVMRSRAIFLVGGLVVAALLGGAVAGSVAAATSTTVTWKVSSLPLGSIEVVFDRMPVTIVADTPVSQLRLVVVAERWSAEDE